MLRKPNYQEDLESSQSDISITDEETYTRQQGFGHQHQLYSDSDEEDSIQAEREENKPEQDSLQQSQYSSSEEQDDDYDPLEHKNNGIHTVREDPQENVEEEDSIDHIEQRIKKLQRDLETKLGKQKDSPKKPGKIVPKAQHPPIPSKSQIKPPTQILNQQMVENKMNSANQIKRPSYGQKLQVEEIKASQILVEKKKKKPIKKDNFKEIVSQPKFEPPKKQNMKKSIPSNQKQIEEMQRTIDQLKLENRRLKDQAQVQKAKKKPIIELQKLKQISHKNAKLQKQIELLQVIEKLQGKLKKSISRKLATNSKSVSATLLHKGLPASMLQQL